MRLIGTISGEVTSTEFNILLSTKNIEKDSFVKINHETYGWVLARIDNMKRYLDTSGEEVTTAHAYTIGYKQEKNLYIPKTPFRPEERVYAADKELIREVIGLNKERTGSIYLGRLEGHDIPIFLDVQKSIGKHMSVLAKTGAGKSYTVAVILEELIKAEVPCIIIDAHGEYSSLRFENDDYDSMIQFGVRPRSYAEQITEYALNTAANPHAKRLTIKPRFTLNELINIMPMKLNENQKSILYEVMRRLNNVDYSIQDIINAVRVEESKAKWKIINGLETLRNSSIFDVDAMPLTDLIEHGRATIINLKGIEPMIQELIITKIAKDLFDATKSKEVDPFFFLIEEAHNFCPERGFGDSLSSSILRTIAAEGRKFGFYLGVVSQRPARVDKNILSQCNMQVILKVTNPNDLRAIGQSIEGFTSGMEEDIKQLSVGQALVVGECVEQPITVKIRARESKHYLGAQTQKKTPPIKAPEETEKKANLMEKIKPAFIKKEEPPVAETDFVPPRKLKPPMKLENPPKKPPKKKTITQELESKKNKKEEKRKRTGMLSIVKKIFLKDPEEV